MEIEKSIEIDFYRPKYISINAKQYDKTSRKVKFVCASEGKVIPIDRMKMYAFVKYRRVDGTGFLNACEIMNDGTIQMVLTEAMLEKSGKCCAEIVVIESDTPRSPVTENGFFAVNHSYDEETGRLSVEFSPDVTVQEEDGAVKISCIDKDGTLIRICDNPAPFAVMNDDNQLILATVDETGKIWIEAPSVISTMPFYVNVVESSFRGKCNEMI